MPDTFPLIALLRRSWWLILLGAVLGGAAASGVASLIPATYRGDAKFIVGPINPDASTLPVSGNLARTYAELAESRPVLRQSLRTADAPLTVEEAEEKVTANANDVTRVVTITVEDRDARVAARLSNAIVDVLERRAAVGAAETARRARAFLEQPELEALSRAERAGVREAALRMNLLGESPAGRITVIEPAERPLEPAGPGRLLIAILGALGGGTLAALIALVREATRVPVTDESVRGDLGIEYLGRVDAPVSSTWPHSLSEAAPKSDAAVGYRLLATRIESARLEGKPRTLLLLDVADGRTSASVAAHLAAAFAEAYPRVVLVEADPTQQGVAAWFGVDQRSRRRDSSPLRNGADPAEEVMRVALRRGAALHVLALGDSKGSATVQAERTEAVLERLSSSADVIVINAAPLHRSSSGAAWARAADGTILALEAGRTSRTAAAETLRVLASEDTNVLGAVLVRRTPLRDVVRRLTARRAAADHARGADGEAPNSPEPARAAGRERL